MTLDLVVRDAVRDVVREEIRAAFAEFRPPTPAAATAPALEQLLGVEDVVSVCNGRVTAPTVRAWCKSGRLIAKKVGRGYLIERAALQRFLSTLQSVSRATPNPEQEASRILSRIRGK